MAKIPYKKLKFLVADDFSNFRSTVSGMLMDLGVEDIDMASNAGEAIDQCSRSHYDVVLCDYNLGAGRNGQHVLEELRFKSLLKMRSIFILVSAESSRNIVMSAYDSAPDDYLMKPITTKMLQNRLERLLQLRFVMEPVYLGLERDDMQAALDVLIDLSIAENRYSTYAQKILGEMFLEEGHYKKAEKLYMNVLEVRELDWARLGLAKSKYLQGDHEQAGQWLDKIVLDNYLYLPAYDVLADNCLAVGDKHEAQCVVQKSVDVSPMSILRQKNLAKLASGNHDLETAVEAMRRVMKLGKLSCYGEYNDRIIFARCVAEAIEKHATMPAAVINEAMAAVSEQHEDADMSSPGAQALYIQSRLCAAQNQTEKAKVILSDAEASLSVDDSEIDIEIDHIRALVALDNKAKVTDLLLHLRELYAHDQSALEKLDEFLDEPASDANQTMVDEVNRAGIELYNNGNFEDALAKFDDAAKRFPKHVGLQLNIIQALVGKLRTNPSDEKTFSHCRVLLESVKSEITENHSHYRRFTQLNNMARAVTKSA